ncbi:conserved hypothetical protein [delta proteobacterium NaphS2]|nr:conserved hypothetical protein [delta proteobacterium NaphS2]
MTSTSLKTESPGERADPKRFLWAMAVVLYLWSFTVASHAYAIDLLAELTAGYDSNPALSDPADGSGFFVYALGAEHYFTLSNDLSLDVSVGGRYQDYWSVGDNYRLDADTALSYVMAEGRFIPSLVGEVAAYRDRLIPADERNEGMVGINADWILSNRLTLGLEQSFRWLNYLNWAKPFSGKGQGRNPNSEGEAEKNGAHTSEALRNLYRVQGTQPTGRGNGTLNKLYPPRNNFLMTTGANLHVFMTSTLTGRLYAAYGDLNASLDMESFREIQAGAAISWIPADQWLTVFELTGFRTYYDSVEEHTMRIRRTNYSWSAGMQVSRFWGDLELFGQLGWKSGQAPLDYESYTQTVVQCGLSYSY